MYQSFDNVLSDDEFEDNNSLIIGDNDKISNKKNKYILYIETIFYLILYLLIIFIIFIYFLFNSLPENNIFNVDSYYLLKTITTPIALILSITKTFVIPRFVNNMSDIFNIHKHTNNIIMILRTIIIIIVPLIISIIFISQCGNLWSIYWDNCQNDNKNIFNINATIWTKTVTLQTTFATTFVPPNKVQLNNLLKSNEVCGFSHNINISKCLRTFYDLWIDILFKSILIMLFTPFLVILYKQLKLQIKNNLNVYQLIHNI